MGNDMDTAILTPAQQQARQLDSWDFELNALVVRFRDLFIRDAAHPPTRQDIIDRTVATINTVMDAVDEIEQRKAAGVTTA